MVLTKAELIGSLQNEVRILLHLMGKVDRSKLDYRPTPKQRSTIELLRYLTMMGPALVQAAKDNVFDTEAWGAAEAVANGQDFDQVVAAITAQGDRYAAMLGDLSDADYRAEVDLFGFKSSRGSFIVNNVLSGCAAYRTQLFLYLKACGREELSTWDLWVGMDAPAES